MGGYTEDDIVMALSAMEGGSSMRQAALNYGFPRSTLQLDLQEDYLIEKHTNVVKRQPRFRKKDQWIGYQFKKHLELALFIDKYEKQAKIYLLLEEVIYYLESDGYRIFQVDIQRFELKDNLESILCVLMVLLPKLLVCGSNSFIFQLYSVLSRKTDGIDLDNEIRPSLFRIKNINVLFKTENMAWLHLIAG